MVLPKAVAAAFFAPWAFVLTVNNLPTDLRLRIQKSDLLQQGTKMRTVKLEPPKLKGVRLMPEVQEITSSFPKEYDTKELELLWAALLACYGSQNRALQAARSNPQIINPSYSFCNTMLQSKEALLEVMSKEEALEVMSKNPAVLQCGPSLAALGASEIKLVGSLRSLLNRVPKRAGLLLSTAFLSIALLPVLVAQNPHLADTRVLGYTESLAGAVVAPVFAVAILYLLKSSSA